MILIFLLFIINTIQNKYNNIFNGNKTFTTFSKIDGININDT